ncbi:MAG: hypothetical protein FWD37_02175 [Methanomassiliicoccaceae archaeon]|nr:hypothetical protein [Methanomassiliicoccaceae archaeon]
MAQLAPWLEYATYGEDGFVNGIRDDAPQEMKDAYYAEKEKRRKNFEKGIIDSY